MSWAALAAGAPELAREGWARIVLHTPVSDSTGSEGEFKVYGRVVATDEPDIRSVRLPWRFVDSRR